MNSGKILRELLLNLSDTLESDKVSRFYALEEVQKATLDAVMDGFESDGVHAIDVVESYFDVLTGKTDKESFKAKILNPLTSENEFPLSFWDYSQGRVYELQKSVLNNVYTILNLIAKKDTNTILAFIPTKYERDFQKLIHLYKYCSDSQKTSLWKNTVALVQMNSYLYNHFTYPLRVVQSLEESVETIQRKIDMFTEFDRALEAREVVSFSAKFRREDVGEMLNLEKSKKESLEEKLSHARNDQSQILKDILDNPDSISIRPGIQPYIETILEKSDGIELSPSVEAHLKNILRKYHESSAFPSGVETFVQYKEDLKELNSITSSFNAHLFFDELDDPLFELSARLTRAINNSQIYLDYLPSEMYEQLYTARNVAKKLNEIVNEMHSQARYRARKEGVSIKQSFEKEEFAKFVRVLNSRKPDITKEVIDDFNIKKDFDFTKLKEKHEIVEQMVLKNKVPTFKERIDKAIKQIDEELIPIEKSSALTYV